MASRSQPNACWTPSTAHSRRPHFPRDLSQRVRERRPSHHRKSAPSRGARRARYVSIARQRSRRCPGSQCGFRLRRRARLCGGPGVAYLYVRPDLGIKLEPKLTGWFAHQDSMAFETGPIRYADPLFRFMNGTTHIPALEACRPGLKILREVRVERIREKSKHQTTHLIELADQNGWRVNTA